MAAWSRGLKPHLVQHPSHRRNVNVGGPHVFICRAERLSAYRQQPHVWKIRQTQGLASQDIPSVARLLAEVFGPGADAEDGDGITPAQLTAYQIRLMGILQIGALTASPCLTTLLAYAPLENAGGSFANNSDDSSVPFMRLAGVVTVDRGLKTTGAEGHPVLPDGQPVAALSNMAVHADFRRQGLGRQLLNRAEAAALEWPETDRPLALALSVHRHNYAAIHLYESEGYVLDTSWTDQRWLSAAEKGHVGFQQRQLMVKFL